MSKILKAHGDDLCSSDIEDIENSGVDLFVYWYENGGYEGQGGAIIFTEGKHWYLNLGHCSCYGPLDRFEDLMSGEITLDALISRFSDELKAEMLEVVKLYSAQFDYYGNLIK